VRLWSLHPRHLDARGLVALWREGLLARAVLAGKTTGYRCHPQLERFRERRDPVAAIDCYLSRVFDEAGRRGYCFDRSKIRYRRCRNRTLVVSAGQLAYERAHLLAKLQRRDRPRWTVEQRRRSEPHPCFCVTEGPVAAWERRSMAVRRHRVADESAHRHVSRKAPAKTRLPGLPSAASTITHARRHPVIHRGPPVSRQHIDRSTRRG
jgi:hypothetical protein